MAYDPNINFYDDPGHPYWPEDGDWHHGSVVPSGGSGGTLMVTINIQETSATLDKTAREILDAVEAGKVIVFYGDDGRLQRYIQNVVIEISHEENGLVVIVGSNSFVADSLDDYPTFRNGSI